MIFSRRNDFVAQDCARIQGLRKTVPARYSEEDSTVILRKSYHCKYTHPLDLQSVALRHLVTSRRGLRARWC